MEIGAIAQAADAGEVNALDPNICIFCEKHGHYRRDCGMFQRARQQLGLTAKPHPRPGSRQKTSKKTNGLRTSPGSKKKVVPGYRRKLIAILESLDSGDDCSEEDSNDDDGEPDHDDDQPNGTGF